MTYVHEVRIIFIVFLSLPFIAGTALGQETSREALARQSKNPVAGLISVPYRNNANLGIGPSDETRNVLNTRPVWPVSISQDWNLITRRLRE